jgi:hypothetical protein
MQSFLRRFAKGLPAACRKMSEVGSFTGGECLRCFQ